MKRRRKAASFAEPAAQVAPRIEGWKLWRLRLIAVVAVPAAFLAIIELALRLLGFGYPTAFLISSVNNNRATWVQNNQFGWRFFGKRMSRAPSPISILKDKPPDTIRIFVFGESAAFGDPQPAFGLPRALQATLSLRHPELKFEVVNAAMTAIDSHVILPIARDCARAGGDIWVVYMGNNEVVGPFGAGTVFGSQALPLPLIRANLALKTTRLGQLIDAARELWQKPPPDKSEWGGMTMFLDQKVAAGDPRMGGVYRNFQRNLADIVRAGHDCGAGVVVSTVAVNLKDCAPFASLHRAGMSEADQRTWDDLMRIGTQAQTAGNLAEAITQFRAAGQLDNASADLQFLLGRCLLATGDMAGAQKALIAARDLDALRFRCDGKLNETIRQAAAGREAEGVLLADAENSFAAASPAGLPGWNFFYEHVHLTFEGNCLLARTLAEQVEKLLPRNAASGSAAWPTVADCARRLGRTDRDLQPALTEMLTRMTDPPFLTQINHDEQVKFLTQEARQAASGGSLTDALQALHVALGAAPEDAQLYEQLAVLEETANHNDEAETAAHRAVELLPSSEEAWSQLGTIFVHEQKFESAATSFQHAFDLNPQDVWPLQNLGMSFSKLGRDDDAIREYRRAVAITPRFGMAWLALGQALERKGRKDEAAECFQKGLQNRIHRPADMATLARFCMSRGWFEAASTNFSDAIKLDPSNPALPQEAGQAHYMLGMELGKSGKAAQAAREFAEAVRLMPNVVEAQLNLGIALYQEGDWNDSLNEFEQVVASNPTNALARHYVEIIRQRRQGKEQP
jgi:tetratricopeptide (TPR) repeat protein